VLLRDKRVALPASEALQMRVGLLPSEIAGVPPVPAGERCEAVGSFLREAANAVRGPLIPPPLTKTVTIFDVVLGNTAVVLALSEPLQEAEPELPGFGCLDDESSIECASKVLPNGDREVELDLARPADRSVPLAAA
jgi:hypothetical protein